ncbi:hypothetical protein QYE76_050258 [Lolium multiflorum]|uniref:DDE Tnp4 domain-containing protein n=1 Tax=Lolium multiflorum TaxID=4521 RepID=A0AAD8SQU9_LOLMU|nr:hypothetical protein QYE76_050258 [Lolium multiflorum]
MNNMADDAGGGTFDWDDHLRSVPFSTFVPLVEADREVVYGGMWNNNWVADQGMERIGVVEGMGNKGGEFMVGAAGSNSQISPSGLREQGLYLSNDHLRSVPFPASVPLVDAGHEVWGMWNNRVVVEGMSNNIGVVEEGMWNNGVVEESMGTKGAEFMVGGAAGSSSQRAPPGGREQGPLSNNHNYGGFEFGVQVPRSTAKVRNKRGAERKTGRAPPGTRRQRSPSGSKEMPSGGSGVDYSKFEPRILKSVVPQGMVNLGDRMGAAPPGAVGSKRRRSPSGWNETGGGSNGEAMGGEASDEFAAFANVGKRKRRVWVKERKSVWWDTVNTPEYTDADFKRDFHMSRSTFDRLCSMLRSSVAKQDTAIRDAIPVRLRVAVSVYRFATGETFLDLGNRFGIGMSTCQNIFLDVTAAINAVFQAEAVSALWPYGPRAMDAAAAKFHDLTGVPGVIGAVYTTHVHIYEPQHQAAFYYNHRLTQRHKGKASFSVALQAAVDASGAFTYFCIGYPGAASDEDIFVRSSMSTTHAGKMVAQGKHLVGGTGYPLTDWTLVPYSHSNLTPPQETFNKKMALARGVALDAFRRLKARWACLQMRVKGNLGVFSSVMAACCVLHNLCERSGDELGHELRGYKLEDDEIVLDNPERSFAATMVRDAIAHNLHHHAGAGGSMQSLRSIGFVARPAE